MYLPRHNCTVTGTQGVHYCWFPIAMKAWVGTSESLPSHVYEFVIMDCEPGRTGSPKRRLWMGSSVESEVVGDWLGSGSDPREQLMDIDSFELSPRRTKVGLVNDCDRYVLTKVCVQRSGDCSEGRMAVRCTEGIEGCRAEYVLTGLGVINDWFWNASKAGVLSILDGWLETKPSLFVHGHVGMVG
ncbi:hypothetical protein F2Q68_00029478 [Brassica cretica]|uniref:Uncharacterized protein n=1 Tax=Brassica cretica TaxID=69181 RepID=A0A8S9G8C8_BRACR|nr:hypothetical protein F2Q68_00029478 [Brassica cretica]